MLWWNRSNHDTFNLLESIFFFLPVMSISSLFTYFVVNVFDLTVYLMNSVSFKLCLCIVFFLLVLPSFICLLWGALSLLFVTKTEVNFVIIIINLYYYDYDFYYTPDVQKPSHLMCCTALQKQSSSHTWRQSSGHHQSNPRLTDTWTHTFRLVGTKQAQQGWEAQAGMGNSVSGLFPYHP